MASLLRHILLAPLLLTACGVVIYDITNRELILEPVRRVIYDIDSGSVEVYAFKRNAINSAYYLTGYETSIKDVGHTLDGDVLHAIMDCDGDELCNANFFTEVPLGTEIEIHSHSGGVKLTGVDAEVEAEVEAGDFTGVGLRSPTFDLSLTSGAVTIDWLDPPETMQIAVESGDVTLTLPAGTYRCDFTTADGAVDNTGITCDPAATASLAISVQTGDIHVGVTP